MAVMRPPRLAGDKKPSSANTSVMVDMEMTCTPLPTSTESMSGCDGGRKTSPCTSFQPVSSCASSCVSISW